MVESGRGGVDESLVKKTVASANDKKKQNRREQNRIPVGGTGMKYNDQAKPGETRVVKRLLQNPDR